MAGVINNDALALTGAAAQQSPFIRYSHLAKNFSHALSEHAKRHTTPFMAIEIGAWVGASSCMLSRILASYIAKNLVHPDSRLHVIDPWMPYFNLTEDTGEHYQEMQQAAQTGDAFKSFQANLARFGNPQVVEIHQGYAKDILPQLTPAGFHFIYIDGSHAYQDVHADITLSKPLCARGAVLCGDDLETLMVADAPTHKHAIATGKDYLNGYHPGVTQAFLDAFGYQPTALHDGYWAMKLSSRLWRARFTPCVVPASTLLVLPPYIPISKEQVILLGEDRPRGVNRLFTYYGVIEVKQSYGPIDFATIDLPAKLGEATDFRLIQSRVQIWEDFLAQLPHL